MPRSRDLLRRHMGAEYLLAFNAEYDLFNAPYTFYAAGQQIRLGLELRF